MNDSRDDVAKTSTWALILKDWQVGNAMVTLTLRGGVQIVGKVMSVDASLKTVDLKFWLPVETQSTVLLSEVVAITGEARP